MGQASSSLVDCVCDGDIQSLKTSLQQRKQQQQSCTTKDKDNNCSDESSQQWLTEVEEAMHAVVGMEIHSAQQFQQLQIALEMLFQAQPRAWASCAGDAAKWTGAHRACVTGNLSFLTFVFQHYDAFDAQERDAFGLFPIDLVPPELLRTPEEMALDAALEPRVGATKEPIFPATARSRRNLALQILRQKKNEAQARCIDQFLFHEHPMQGSVARTADKSEGSGKAGDSESEAPEPQKPRRNATAGERSTEPSDNQEEHRRHTEAHTTRMSTDEDTAANGAYYIAFESSRDHLVPAADSTNAAGSCNSMGEVHERSTPLRLKYRFPRLDEFLNGYFQLIWRDGAGQPRSEEPHYDTHVLMRDEMFLDPQGLEFFEDADGSNGARILNLQEKQGSPTLGSGVGGPGNQEQQQQQSRKRQNSSHRRLEDANPVLQGCFPFDVSRIPHDAVCHVLFVACDKHLMKRTVVLSTEGIALRDANDDYDFLALRNYEDDNEGDDEEDDDEDSDSEQQGFVFHVAGEAFSHANPVFDGKSFAGIEDFEQFVRSLRSASDQQLRTSETEKSNRDVGPGLEPQKTRDERGGEDEASLSKDVDPEVAAEDTADLKAECAGAGVETADSTEELRVAELTKETNEAEVLEEREALSRLLAQQCEQEHERGEEEEDNQREYDEAEAEDDADDPSDQGVGAQDGE